MYTNESVGKVTATTATLDETTPRAVEYRATYCGCKSAPERERATTCDLQCLSEICLSEVCRNRPQSSLDVVAPPWRRLVTDRE